jgi:DNA (cytosine-5)-methyltransferase 1
MVTAKTRARLDAARRLLDAPPPAPTPGQLTVPTGPRIGSVCTGYGGLDEAVMSVLGGSLAWVADPDDGPARILAHHHPDTPNHGDITALDWSAVEPVDVLIGGYPCQPFSVAGQRKGTADDRHIWPHIAAAIRVLRPRLCFFENVAGHVRLGLDSVLADLAALRFDAEWLVVRASDVDAPHQRPRIFLLAWPADTSGGGREEGPGLHASGATQLGRRRLGDARRPVAADAQSDGHRNPRPASKRGLAPATVAGSSTAHANPASVRRGEGRTEPARQQRRSHVAECGAPDWGRYAAAIARWEAATGRPAPRPTDDRGRLAPAFVEWLMGLTPGHVTAVPGLSRAQQLKALGNGVVPPQAAYAFRVLLDRAGLAHLFGLAA